MHSVHCRYKPMLVLQLSQSTSSERRLRHAGIRRASFRAVPRNPVPQSKDPRTTLRSRSPSKGSTSSLGLGTSRDEAVDGRGMPWPWCSGAPVLVQRARGLREITRIKLADAQRVRALVSLSLSLCCERGIDLRASGHTSWRVHRHQV